jgi:hypothetical protein
MGAEKILGRLVDFNGLLRVKFSFVSVVTKYLKFAALSKDLLCVFMLRLCPSFCSLNMGVPYNLVSFLIIYLQDNIFHRS